MTVAERDFAMDLGRALALSDPVYTPKQPSPLARAMSAKHLSTEGRALEYYCAIVMVCWATVMAMPGDTLAAGSLKPLLDHGIQEAWVAGLYGAMGALRLLTLVINGRWPHGPWLRMIGAFFGFALWAQVVGVLVVHTSHTGVFTTGIAVYFPMAMAELYSIYRASSDGRYGAR